MGIVLGVMARAPVAGACKTRLASRLGDAAAAQLYGAMLLDTLDILGRTAADRRVVFTTPDHHGVAVLERLVPSGWEVIAQRGDGLTARLQHALQTLHGNGNVVVLVGSDSPTLPVAALVTALGRAADPNRVLLGPARDGGYYLIGLSKLEPRVFDDIPWSTAAVADATRRRCAELGLHVEELPTACDVDQPDDLELLRVDLDTDPQRAPRTATQLRAIFNAQGL